MSAAADRAGNWARKPILVIALLFAVPAVAQSVSPVLSAAKQRVVLISLPDRQLAVISDGNVIAKFPVAVGATESPSPTGEFHIVNRVANPTYYRPGTVIPSGKDNPVGTRWLGAEPERLWHSRNERSPVDWTGRFAWMHPAAQSRHGAPVHDGTGRRSSGDSRGTR